MKKILLVISVFFLINNLCAQKSNLIIGDWVFTKALNKDIDEASLAYMRAEIIGKWKINFKSDGKFYTSMMGEKTIGNWKYNSKFNSITLTGMEGGSQEFKILKSTENQLALKLGLGEFLLTKTEE